MQYAVPLRSDIHHPHVLWTDKENNCGVDFSKAVVIKEGNIDLTTVKKVNTAAYKDYEIRIRSMACIDTIIKNCEYLWYPSGKIPNSQIAVKYLLLKGFDEKNLHLGIDTYKVDRPFFTRTLLITEGDNARKFIGKADESYGIIAVYTYNKNNVNNII